MTKIDPFDDGLPLPVYMRQVAFEMRDRFIADAAEPLRIYSGQVAYELARMLGEERPLPKGTLSACDRERAHEAQKLRSLTEAQLCQHLRSQVIDQVNAEGRSGKIKAMVIKADGAEKPLPETWWRGSEAAACLGGAPHPEGDLRVRHASRHELNTPDYRKARALEWLRAEYPKRVARGESVTKPACLKAFEVETEIRIGETARKKPWDLWKPEAKARFPHRESGATS